MKCCLSNFKKSISCIFQKKPIEYFYKDWLISKYIQRLYGNT